MLKRIKSLLLVGALSIGVVGCNSTNTSLKEDRTKICVVLDEGGANDQSFNQSAIEGLYRAKENYDIEVSYIESKSEGLPLPSPKDLLRAAIQASICL